jgi:predicted NUDIX family NTP pyrophosphohydrolase
MSQRSAGILLYRLTDTAPEALPVHHGGPFWAKNDDGAWSIPAKTQSRHRARRPLAGLLPCEEDPVHGPNAQIAVIRRRLGEQLKSTLCCPLRSAR